MDFCERNINVFKHSREFVYLFFSSVDLCCMYFEALLVGAYTFRTVMSPFVMFTWPFCNYVMFLFIPSNFTYSEVFFM